MRRHPSAIAREQRGMTQARTVGHRHRAAGDDARDQDAATTDDQDRRRCRVVRWLSPTQHEVIAHTTVTDGIALAARIGRRCVVVDLRGTVLYDNRQEYV